MKRLYELAGVPHDSKPAEIARVINASPQQVNSWKKRGLSLPAAYEYQAKYGCNDLWQLTKEGQKLLEKQAEGMPGSGQESAGSAIPDQSISSPPQDPLRRAILPTAVTIDLPAKAIAVWEDLESLEENEREEWIDRLTIRAAEVRMARRQWKLEKAGDPQRERHKKVA